MADQYWVVPVGGLAWEQRAIGVPVDKLPGTSGMIQIKLDAPFTQVCYPANPGSGGGVRCQVSGEVSIQVLSPAGHGYGSYLWGAFVTTSRNADEAFDGVSVVVDISPRVLLFGYGGSNILPPSARLYVAFDAPRQRGVAYRARQVYGRWESAPGRERPQPRALAHRFSHVHGQLGATRVLDRLRECGGGRMTPKTYRAYTRPQKTLPVKSRT